MKKQIIVAIGREHAYQRAGNAEFGERLGAFLLLARLIEIGGEGIFIFNHSGIGHNGLSCQTLRTLRKPVNSSPCPILLPWLRLVADATGSCVR